MNEFAWKDGGTGDLIVNGTRLEYACWGSSPSEKPTLVMLHEGLGCVALWRDFPKRLAEATGFGVFAYSRAGYGQSDLVQLPRPLDYMTREAADVLPDVLNHIRFKRGVLLGHSDGASIAAIYAGSIEDHRVRGLVLIAPHFFTEPIGLEEIERAKTNFNSTDLKPRMAKYHRDPDTAFWGWNDAWLDPDFREWNISEVIDYLRVPVLAVQGVKDPYGTLDQIEEIEHRIYAPVDTEIINDCGHSPHLEFPDQTTAAVADFCARLERIEHEQVRIA